ncbi:hypothetical protein WDZ17_05055 [Pseudokineococcus basanitobsidens]|uniref:Ricin-type beta-trefoil lectin protein n=1 Tax=Pseudokineococcus basanitobsidens TaxID=1926649 RepID=A0ABU8RHU5_9ACTN
MGRTLPDRLGAALREEDRGAAMLTALMLIMVVGTLSVLVLGTLVSQVRPASLVQKTTRTVFAAETGSQVALGEMRTNLAAADSNGDVYGDPTKLPCTLSGPVGESSAQLTYAVTVQYFAADPSALSSAQRSSAAMTCGTSGGRGVTTAPAYAVISSKGFDAGVPGLATTSGDRTLETQYAFQVTNKNVPGGLFRTSDTGFCLEAESAQAGSGVRYRSDCSSRNARMLWVHAKQSYIQLASTIGTSTPLCLQGPTGPSGGQELVRLQACAVTGPQLFSYKGSFRYQAQNDSNTGVGTRCLWSGSQSAALENARLRSSADGCVRSGDDSYLVRPYWSWNPEPAVGAGSASQPSSLQLVNYAEFGRCLEVTQENLWADRMGIGPCKQAVPGNGNRWNQVWARSEPADGTSSVTTALSVNNPYDAYDKRCLQTPGAGASPAYPVLAYCSSGEPDQVFTRTTATSSYTTSYLLVDRYGRCLGGGPTYFPDGSALTSVVAEPCDGSLDQKWNAPPNTTPAGQSNTHEGG